jgi:hypothetical protein
MTEYTQILNGFGQTIKMESSKGEIIEFEYDGKYNLIRKKSYNPELEKAGFKEDSVQDYTFKYDNNRNPLHNCLPLWSYFNVLNISGGENNCNKFIMNKDSDKEESYTYKYLYDKNGYPAKIESGKSIIKYRYD